jgi:hypothetical protein
MLLALLASLARADDSAFTRNPEGIGLGIIVGAPTGFSFAWRPEGRYLVDGGLAWSFSPVPGGVTSYVQVHADFCLDIADMRTAELPDMHFPVWVGVGPRAHFGGGTGSEAFNLAARIPVAMGFWHTNLPIEGFVELAPGIGLFPESEFTMDAAIGVRFFIAAPGGGPRYVGADPDAFQPY